MSCTSILDKDDRKKIVDLLDGDISGWFGNNTGGPYLQEFEKQFANYLGAKHAYTVSSGSVSIYVALRALNIGLYSQVAVPSYTHIGSVAPILLAGGLPVFVDVDEYGNMDPEDLRRVLDTDNGETDAVIVVHQLGMPCDMDGIRKVIEEVEEKRNCPIIEDASHALGSTYFDKKAGTLGDIGCFSIGGGRTKIIGTGEGGMVITDDEKLAEKCRNIRNHGDRVTDVSYRCFNFRMSELNALIGLLQMKHLPTLLPWQEMGATSIISQLPKFLSVLRTPSGRHTNRYLIGCRYETELATETHDEFLTRVRNKIQCGEPRRNISGGYSKLVSDIKLYQMLPIKPRPLPQSHALVKDSVWIDWHRYPRTEADITELLKAMENV